MPADLRYRFVRSALTLAVQSFFRQIQVEGQDQLKRHRDKAVVLVGNHPNSLLDPLLLVMSLKRPVYFAAKHTLFRSRFLRFFLYSLGAVPIVRRSDTPASTSEGDGSTPRNNACFAALHDKLGAGDCVGIFPEGVSHMRAQLDPFKTGAARLACEFVAQHGPGSIVIIPCGLVYLHRQRFRSRVLVSFGPEIDFEVDRQYTGSRPQDQQQVRALTEAIETAVRLLTINGSDWTTLRELDAVRRLYQPARIPLAHRVELARRFSRVYQSIRHEPEVVQLMQAVRDYEERRVALGLRDDDLRAESRTAPTASLLLRRTLIAGFWLPFALPGLVLHAPIGLAARWLASTLITRPDVEATAKLLTAFVGAGLTYFVLLLVVAASKGPLWLALTAATLAISAVANLRILDQVQSLRQLWRCILTGFTARASLTELRQLRTLLEERVVAMVERHRPPEIDPLYPRDV